MCGYQIGTVECRGDGVTIWEGAVAVAREENPEQVDSILIAIGQVNAVSDDKSSDSDDFEIKTFCYVN